MANVAVVMKVAGGPIRATLMEVDDFLSDRSDRMSQSDLRQLVRDQLFNIARERAFVHYE